MSTVLDRFTDPEEDAQGMPEEPSPQVAALLRSRIASWRDQWRELEGILKVPPEELNGRRWTLGLEIARTLGEIGDAAPRTHTLGMIGEGVGCKLTEIYRMLDIAIAFPDELPRQRWAALYLLAKMPPEERQELLAGMEPWARLRRFARQRREAPPGVAEIRAESRYRGRFHSDADAAFRSLPALEKIDLLIEWLRSIDSALLDAIPLPQEMVEQIIKAALALRELLPELASGASGAESDPNGGPSA